MLLLSLRLVFGATPVNGTSTRWATAWNYSVEELTRLVAPTLAHWTFLRQRDFRERERAGFSDGRRLGGDINEVRVAKGLRHQVQDDANETGAECYPSPLFKSPHVQRSLAKRAAGPRTTVLQHRPAPLLDAPSWTWPSPDSGMANVSPTDPPGSDVFTHRGSEMAWKAKKLLLEVMLRYWLIRAIFSRGAR